VPATAELGDMGPSKTWAWARTRTLYTNAECAVEMGLGYHAGRYTQQGDTLRLTYQEGLLPGLPTRLLLTPRYLVTLPSPQYPHSISIRRQ
jgi:hypothetical protein